MFTSRQTDSTKIIDSINVVRTKINESNKNYFKDFSGKHKFTHNLIKTLGLVTFKKIEDEGDHYDIPRSIRPSIKGFIAVVSEKHMNFTGKSFKVFPRTTTESLTLERKPQPSFPKTAEKLTGCRI